MDLNIIAVVSALETAVLLPKGDLFGMPAVKVWLGLVLGQYIVAKMYSIFLYPHFVSPLRHLPGPKVLQDGGGLPLLGSRALHRSSGCLLEVSSLS